MINRENTFSLVTFGQEFKWDVVGNFNTPEQEVEGVGKICLIGAGEGMFSYPADRPGLVITPKGLIKGRAMGLSSRGLFDLNVSIEELTVPTRLSAVTVYLPNDLGVLRARLIIENDLTHPEYATKEEIDQNWIARTNQWHLIEDNKSYYFFSSAEVEELAKLQFQLHFNKKPRRLTY